MTVDPTAGGNAERPVVGPSREYALEAMQLAQRVGEVMVANAESVSDCVEGMRRVLRALGLADCAVVVEMRVVTLSWQPPTGEPITMVREAPGDDPHLHRLVKVQRLVGRIESGELDVESAHRALDTAAVAPDPYPRWVVAAARLVSAAGWVVFSGGNWQSVLVGIGATALVLPVVAAVSRARIPDVFATLVGTIGVVSVPYLLVWAGLDFPVGPAAVGGLYQFLPGRMLVASVNDGLSGAPTSALARGLQAVVLAVGVAVGVLATLRLAEVLGVSVPEVSPGRWGVVITMVAAGAAAGALAVGRQVPPLAVVPVLLLSMVAWLLANDLTVDSRWARPAAVGVAALVLGFGGQVLARVQRTVPTLYTSAAVLVLVPGTILYTAMLEFATGDTSKGGDLTVQAVSISIAIAAGTTLGVAVGRAIPALSLSRVRLVPPGRPAGG